jgi:hypothetical protein
VIQEDLAVLSLNICSNTESQSWVQEVSIALGDTEIRTETDEARGRSLRADLCELRDKVRAKLYKNRAGLSPAGSYKVSLWPLYGYLFVHPRHLECKLSGDK